MGNRLAIVGGGSMGSALARGLVSSGWADYRGICVIEASAQRRDELAAELPELTVRSEWGAVSGTDFRDALLAVKPQDAEPALRSASAAGVSRVLSIAAGIPVRRLEEWLEKDAVVVRAMPNTPALVGHGIAAVAGGTRAGEADMAWATSILGAVGEVVVVDEDALDAVTGVSGSGPAYFFAMVEALTGAAVEVGLQPDVAAHLARATFAGAAHLLEETGRQPDELRVQVTSPGGTTAAGLAALAHGFPQAVSAAVRAATVRAHELGA